MFLPSHIDLIFVQHWGYMYFCIKSSIGNQDEVGWPYKCFNPSAVYSTDRSKAVVPMLVLLFVALWFILRVDWF